MQHAMDQDRPYFDLIKDKIVVDNEAPIAKSRDCLVVRSSSDKGVALQGLQLPVDAIKGCGCCGGVLRGQIGKQFLQILFGDREESDDICFI